jgi:hypothetical protein
MDAVPERTFTDLLQRPTEVAAEVSRHDVILRRRGQANDLLLSQANRSQAVRDAVLALGQMLRLAMNVPGGSDLLAERVDEMLPWTHFLDESQRRQFVSGLAAVASATAETGNFAPLVQTMNEWKATALIMADPDAVADLARPLDEEDLASEEELEAAREAATVFVNTRVKIIPQSGGGAQPAEGYEEGDDEDVFRTAEALGIDVRQPLGSRYHDVADATVQEQDMRSSRDR